MARPPINLRLSAERLHELDLRARARNMPLRTLAQRYLEEGMRMEAHPLIRFVDGPYGRSATIVGTDLDVWQIVRHLQGVNGQTASVDDVASATGLTGGQITAGLDYYSTFGVEIDAQLELATMNTRSVRELFPSPPGNSPSRD